MSAAATVTMVVVVVAVVAQKAAFGNEVERVKVPTNLEAYTKALQNKDR
jgi:hypothetical protein